MFLNIIDNLIYNYITEFTIELNNNNNINIDIYINKIDFKNLNNIIKDNNDVENIIKIIKDYIYIFNLLYKNYDKNKEHINKIILQNNIINNNIISSINKIVDIKEDLIKLQLNNYNYELPIYSDNNFIKNINIEYYKSNINNKLNLLLYIIITQLYINHDKYMIYEIIEKQNIKHNIFKYIEIINNNDIVYTYDIIYNMLYDYNNINKNDIDDIFNLINDIDDNNIKYSNNDIINNIFNNYSLFPITDEFFLINKNDLFFIKKKELNI